MPWGDGTGPWWMGSRGYGASAYARRNPWCIGRGMWRRQAFMPRYGYTPQFAPGDEIGYLEDMAGQMEQELRNIRERIEVLRSKQ